MSDKTVSIVATKSTTALYMLARLVNVDFVQLVCLYEIYREDIFCIFYMLEGNKLKFENGTCKYFPEEKVFNKIFERAQIVLDALQGFPRQIKRYDMRIYRELEKLYVNGKYVMQVHQ